MSETVIRYINTRSWQGEYGFSQAVSIPAGARRLLLAGVGSEGDTGRPSHPGDALEQCRAAWRSILSVLEAEGGTHTNIVAVRTYVTDPRYLADVSSSRKDVFGDGPYPIHTFLVVSQLAEPGMLIEIGVEAAILPTDANQPRPHQE